MQRKEQKNQGTNNTPPSTPQRTASTYLNYRAQIEAARQSRKKKEDRTGVGMVSNTYRIHLSKVEEAFDALNQQFAAQEEKLTSQERKAAFDKILPHIQNLQHSIQLLMTTPYQREFGAAEASRIINAYRNKIGLAYFYNQDYPTAREWFSLAANAGLLEGAQNLAGVAHKENNKEAIPAATLLYLELASKNKLGPSDRRYTNLTAMVLDLIFIFLQTNKDEGILEVLDRYPQYVTDDVYVELLQNYPDATPAQKAEWRKRFLPWVKKFAPLDERSSQDEYTFFNNQVVELADYYFVEQQFLSAVLLIEGHKTLFNMQTLALYAGRILTTNILDKTSKRIAEKAKAWLMQGVAERDQSAIACYLEMALVNNNNDLFPAKETATTVQNLLTQDNEEPNQALMHLHLGQFYDTGIGVLQDDSLAFTHYQKAAELKNSIAQQNLAAMYYAGQGTPPDLKKAIALYQESFSQDNVEAGIGLASCLAEDQHDPAEVLKILDQAQSMLNSKRHIPSKFTQATQGMLSFIRAQSLLAKNAPLVIVEEEKQQRREYHLKFQPMITADSPQILQGFLNAVSYANNDHKQVALCLLGLLYLHGMHTPRNLAKSAVIMG